MFKAPALEPLTRRLIPLIRTQCLSALIQPQQDKIDSFRTNETNPLKHNKDHVGKFYKISPDVEQHIFQHGGFPKTYKMHTKSFAETCLMIRQPAIEIISYINSIDLKKPPVRFVLYGKKGNGKSLTLAHLIHYAYESGFLIIHVPWVGNWMRRCKDYSNSETKKGFTDLNLDAAAWLVHFKVQNSHLLSNPELRVSKDYNWSKREITPKDSPLIDMIEHGVTRVKFASEVVIALAEEIKLLSTKGICKTFVAIDGFNGFFYPYPRVWTEKKEIVHPSKITLTEAFLNLTKFNWKNGVAVVTVDEIAIAEKDQISHMPKYLLGKDGFEHLDPFIPVEVGEYTEKELKSCLDYYRERKWIQVHPGQDKELGFLSACNPYRIMLLSGPL